MSLYIPRTPILTPTASVLRRSDRSPGQSHGRLGVWAGFLSAHKAALKPAAETRAGASSCACFRVKHLDMVPSSYKALDECIVVLTMAATEP